MFRIITLEESRGDKKMLSIKLSQEDREKLRELAKSEFLTTSAYVRRLVLKQYEKRFLNSEATATDDRLHK